LSGLISKDKIVVRTEWKFLHFSFSRFLLGGFRAGKGHHEKRDVFHPFGRFLLRHPVTSDPTSLEIKEKILRSLGREDAGTIPNPPGVFNTRVWKSIPLVSHVRYRSRNATKKIFLYRISKIMRCLRNFIVAKFPLRRPNLGVFLPNHDFFPFSFFCYLILRCQPGRIYRKGPKCDEHWKRFSLPV